ncbi:MAG TPA: exostosin family protein [Candidatus Methylacidiphilales bacterium]
MAKVLLLSLSEEDPRDNSYRRGAYLRLKQSAELGKSHHRLVDDPAEADIILFAETHFMFAFRQRRHPYYRAFRDKCFGFAVNDHVLPFLPGVYPSIEKDWFSPGRVRSGFYLSILENPYTSFDPEPIERDFLYCFVGSTSTAPIRVRLGKLQHPRGVFIDTAQVSQFMLHEGTPEQRTVFWKDYADKARRSQFVLCPRGEGTSSVRLFETMEMGRAPVILADKWVPPEGPCWEQFSLRIPEREVMNLPRILEEREKEAVAMGLKAREEWERWFSPEARFNTVVDWCLQIKADRRLPEYLACLGVYPQILRWPFRRAYLRRWRSFFLPKQPPQS